MSTVYAALIFGALSFLVWVIWFTSSRSKGKGLLQNFRVIAEKYSFEIDESSTSGKLVMPVLRGNYKKPANIHSEYSILKQCKYLGPKSAFLL